MTPSETARAALQKALEALTGTLPELPQPYIGAYGDATLNKVRLAIEQALAELAAEEPPTASMDEKALEIAFRLMAVIVPDMPIARYWATIQVAILEAMQWMRSQNAKDAARYRLIESIVVDMGHCYEIPLEPGATLAETVDAAAVR